MDEEKRDKIQDEIDPKFGELVMYWTVKDFHRHERSILWYVLFFVIGIALILYAILTANYIFAVLLVMIGAFMVIRHFQDPQDVPVVILTTGIAIGNHYHEWDEVKDFAIVYEPPEVRKLYVDFNRLRHPYVSLDIPEEMDPNDLREAMLEFADEDLDRKDEHLTDLVSRLYKF